MDDFVNFGAFSYSKKLWHPLNAVLNEFDAGTGFDHRTSILSKFYATYNLNGNKGFLPVHSGHWNSVIITYIPPWGGGKETNHSNDFEHWIGPKTPEQIDNFLKNFHELYLKIKKEGYKPLKYKDGFLRVIILRNVRKTKFLVVGGLKRSSILSHCGYKKVWVRLQYPSKNFPGNMPSVVDVKDLDNWPHVINGLYTKKDAMAFFCEYFKEDNRNTFIIENLQDDSRKN